MALVHDLLLVYPQQEGVHLIAFLQYRADGAMPTANTARKCRISLGTRVPPLVPECLTDPAYWDSQVWPEATHRQAWSKGVSQRQSSPSVREVAAVPFDRRFHTRLKAGFVCIEVSTRDLDDLNGRHRGGHCDPGARRREGIRRCHHEQ